MTLRLASLPKASWEAASRVMPWSARAVCRSVAGREVTARQRSDTGVRQSQEQGPAAASSPHPQLQMGGTAPQHTARTLAWAASTAGQGPAVRPASGRPDKAHSLPPVLAPSAKGCGWSGVQRSPTDVRCHGQGEPIHLAFQLGPSRPHRGVSAPPHPPCNEKDLWPTAWGIRRPAHPDRSSPAAKALGLLELGPSVLRGLSGSGPPQGTESA